MTQILNSTMWMMALSGGTTKSWVTSMIAGNHGFRQLASLFNLSLAHSSPEEPASYVDLRKDSSDRGLQIVVKLTNIYLTPERPRYDGGTWHVEG
jgi:hypothetical protein